MKNQSTLMAKRGRQKVISVKVGNNLVVYNGIIQKHRWKQIIENWSNRKLWSSNKFNRISIEGNFVGIIIKIHSRRKIFYSLIVISTKARTKTSELEINVLFYKSEIQKIFLVGNFINYFFVIFDPKIKEDNKYYNLLYGFTC